MAAMNVFKGKVAVVTGGGGGLGAAFCRALASVGAQVVVADIRKDMAEQVAAAIGGEAVCLDVSNSDQIKSLLQQTRQKYGSLDLVINNAGKLVGGEPWEIATEVWEEVIRINLLGVITGSVAALELMKEQRSGTILNIGSTTGIALCPMLGPYTASKAGVVFFSRGLAEEALAYGVHVAVGCPGNIRTGLTPPHVTPWMPLMEPDYVARRMLNALAKRKRLIVFPYYAKLWWWLDRINPELLTPFRQIVVKRARARAAARTSDPTGIGGE